MCHVRPRQPCVRGSVCFAKAKTGSLQELRARQRCEKKSTSDSGGAKAVTERKNGMEKKSYRGKGKERRRPLPRFFLGSEITSSSLTISKIFGIGTSIRAIPLLVCILNSGFLVLLRIMLVAQKRLCIKGSLIRGQHMLDTTYKLSILVISPMY